MDRVPDVDSGTSLHQQPDQATVGQPVVTELSAESGGRMGPLGFEPRTYGL